MVDDSLDDFTVFFFFWRGVLVFKYECVLLIVLVKLDTLSFIYNSKQIVRRQKIKVIKIIFLILNLKKKKIYEPLIL